jgi:hypothetical protein
VRSWFALLACFAVVFSTSAEPPATNANRFLFIIDTSASMRPFDKALRETVFDLVYSGVRGHMTNGDTYGLWVVNDQTDTSFAMESWGQRYSVELGGKATAHVKKYGYQGKARLDLAFAEALRIAKRVGDLTIVLVSNGETPIAGTSFDSVVNDAFRQLVPEMKRAKATLNTVFVARDGEVVAWAANTSDFLVAVPYVPLNPKAAVAEVIVTKTNAPAAPPANAVAKVAAPTPIAPIVEPPRPRIVPKPIIITKETVAEEKRTYQSLTMTGAGATNESAPATIVTNSVAAERSVPQTNVEKVAVTNVAELKPVVAATNAISAATNRSTTNAALALIRSKSTDSAVAVETPTAAVANVSAPEPAQASHRIHPALWAGIGAAVALLCVLAIVVAVRSRRQEPSLISQTMGLTRIDSPKI